MVRAALLAIGLALLCGRVAMVATADEEAAPKKKAVECESTQGFISIILKPEWSPLGVQRFLELVESEHFDGDVPLFRCVEGFLCQFGYLPDNRSREDTFNDDPKHSESLPFRRGYLSFAGSGPNTRSSHLFVTLGDNVEALGKESWETPIGYVTEDSMRAVVSKWNTEYGDMPPWGNGPDPQKIVSEGIDYVDGNFPDLDFIVNCKVIDEEEIRPIHPHDDDDYQPEEEGDAYDGEERHSDDEDDERDEEDEDPEEEL